MFSFTQRILYCQKRSLHVHQVGAGWALKLQRRGIFLFPSANPRRSILLLMWSVTHSYLSEMLILFHLALVCRSSTSEFILRLSGVYSLRLGYGSLGFLLRVADSKLIKWIEESGNFLFFIFHSKDATFADSIVCPFFAAPLHTWHKWRLTM